MNMEITVFYLIIIGGLVFCYNIPYQYFKYKFQKKKREVKKSGRKRL